MSSKNLISQMMAALENKKNAQKPLAKNPDGTVKIGKPTRGTGPIPKPPKKVTGRGR